MVCLLSHQVSQLREIFEVRWSVFLLGPAGCGKTAIWRTLMKAQNNFGEKTVGGCSVLRPGCCAMQLCCTMRLPALSQPCLLSHSHCSRLADLSTYAHHPPWHRRSSGPSTPKL